jgi:hypothetical protein
MKSIFNISLLFLVIGTLTTAPISKHLCQNLMSHTTMSQDMESHCCDHEDSPIDCCHDEINDFNINNIINYSFENIAIGKSSDFWANYIYAEIDQDIDTFPFTKKYFELQNINPKNDIGIYKYVQSFLI